MTTAFVGSQNLVTINLVLARFNNALTLALLLVNVMLEISFLLIVFLSKKRCFFAMDERNV